MHWNNILKVQLFPDQAAIVAVLSRTAPGYNPTLEECVAYGITLLTMLGTLSIVGKMHDSKSPKTAMQTLFPKNEHMHQMSTREFYELATRINLI